MSDVHESTFIIAREDRAVSPKTLLSDGLRIGRLPDSDVWLNHPTVSRLHAGISKIEDYFYLINLSASSATTLNGRAIPFNESDALDARSEEHTSELQSRLHLVCRLLLEKKKSQSIFRRIYANK